MNEEEERGYRKEYTEKEENKSQQPQERALEILKMGFCTILKLNQKAKAEG